MEKVIEGIVSRIFFHNKENGYAVIKVELVRSLKSVTAVGILPGVALDQRLRLTGQWVTHPRYGKQFKVERYTQSLPTTARGIREYLASGQIKGVGFINAARIVKRFGDDTVRVLDEEPHRLREIPGIGRGRADAIAESWQKHHSNRRTMIWLQGHGIPAGLAAKINKVYGPDVIGTVQENPYRLIDDVQGVGFKKADQIAREIGIARNAPSRVQAGVVHTLKEQAKEGNVFTPMNTLVTQASRLLAVPSDLIREAVKSLQAQSDVYCDDGSAVYLALYYEAEVGVAQCLHTLMKRPAACKVKWSSDLLARATRKSNIELSVEQRDAVRTAITGKVTVLTGGPGTGKTQTVRTIVEVLEQMGGWADDSYALCAPTGRAAKRLSEMTKRPARTVHRLLGYNPEKGFLHTAGNPLPFDYLILDEASMLDLRLTYHLLRALRPSTQVLFVGDVDQLPSVGAGNVLHDLIASDRIPVVCLTRIFRQATDSGIVVNAHRINQGETPILNEYDDFYFFGQPTPDEAANMLVDVVQRRIPEKFGLRSIDDLQVLSPMYRGSCGVDALNERLQKVLNPAARHKAELKLPGRVFRVGDKMMQTRNDYGKDVFNGDVGRVAAIDSKRKELLVKVDGRIVSYTWGDTGDLKHAFAMSIHKSQGSEYPAVIVPMTTQHRLMLQRNLLYTAVTRAKSLAVLVGTRQAVNIAVNNNKVTQRRSGLRMRL